MSSSNNSEMEKLSLRPDNMVEDELVQITLTVLTKNIAPTLPKSYTIFVYAQWLDVHRQSPSALTQDWVSTSQQWVHALRSLGFSPTEIILGLDEWKMVTGNFPLPGSGSRSLPSSYEIIMWYGNHAIESYPQAGNSDHLGYCKAYECLFEPPPAGYACTRCGVLGHYLPFCPTNLDPAYDMAPGDTYICTVCHVSGDHYRSLCPHNTDPMSLTQLRRMWLIGAGQAHLACPLPVANPSAENEHKKMQQAFRFDKATNADNRTFQNGKRGRQMSSTPSRSPNEGSPTPDKKQSLRKRMRRIAVYEDKLANGKTLGSTQIEMIQKKENIRNELKNLDEKDNGIMDKEYGGEYHLNDGLYCPSFSSSGSRGSFNNASIGQPTTSSGVLRVPTYNEFAQKLMECHREEMIAVVNIPKPRATALDKWEFLEAYKQELQHLAARGVDISSDPFLDDNNVSRTLSAAAYSYNPVNHTGDKAAFKAPGAASSEKLAYPETHLAATKTDGNNLLDGSIPDAPSKIFDKVIAPPKHFDKVIAPPKHFDKVIAPPKRVPKDITNLPKKVAPKKADDIFIGECGARMTAIPCGF